MALHVMEEANRCLGCKKPRCREGCPIHTNIPEVIRLLKEQRLNEAGWMLFENNPLTTVCSLVCNHEKQCEGHCVRGIKDVPVHFSIIENYISTTYTNQMVKGPAPFNGRRVAIVGAGPAGLTIAVILARYGYGVTIFDSKDKIGGVMRYGIPDFRLPDAVLDDFAYRHLELKGIQFRPNTTVGGSITIDDMFRDGYQSVFVGAGLWKPRSLHIKGESLGHVAFAINYLASPAAFRLGERVIVIGSGNSAMDCARTAIRNGAQYVTVFNRRDQISASQYESSYAKLEGVNFEMMKIPVEILEDSVVFADSEWGEDGKLRAIPGSEKRYPCTGVIVHKGHRHQAIRPSDRGRGRQDFPSRRVCGRRRGPGGPHRGGSGGKRQACGGGDARLYAVAPHAGELLLCRAAPHRTNGVERSDGTDPALILFSD